MVAARQQDARQPTMRARRKRGCRDNSWSRSGAIRSRRYLQRTGPLLLPYPVASRARLRECRQIPRPAATETQPTRFWPCAVRRQRQPEYAQGLLISIHRLLITSPPIMPARRETSPCGRRRSSSHPPSNPPPPPPPPSPPPIIF